MPDEDRPGADAAVGDRLEVGELTLQVGDRLVGRLPVDVGLGRQIPHPASDSAADPDLDQAVDHLVEEADRARLEKAGRARFQHLDRCELRRQSFLGGRVDRVEPAQPDEHVLLERRVVGDVAAGQGFAGDVDVAVHHSRRDDEVIATDDSGLGVARHEVGRLADLDDAIALHEHCPVANDVARGVHRHHLRAGDQRLSPLVGVTHGTRT